ncbi:hypothetical protein ACFL27_26250, partial [candidate division CSSED10-310 bacterium]
MNSFVSLGMKKKQKKIAIGIGIAIGIVFVILLGVIFFIKTNYGQRLIQTKVNSFIVGSITWEELQFSLLRGKVDLTQFVIKDRADKDLVGFERFSADVAWLTLLKGDITVDSLILSNPWGDLIQDQEGAINVLKALAPAEPGLPEPVEEPVPQVEGKFGFNVIIKELRLEQGRFSYQQLRDKLQTALKNIRLNVSGNLLQKSAQLSLQVEQGNVASPAFHAEVTPFSLQAQLVQGDLTDLKLTVNTPSSSVKLFGKVLHLLEKPLLDLHLDLVLDLPEVRDFLHLKPSYTGRITSRIDILESLDSPTITARLDYAGGHIHDYAIDQIDVDLSLEDRMVAITNVLLKLASGELNLAGQADLKSAFPQGFMDQTKNMEAIAYQLELKQKNLHFHELLENDDVQGVADADISVSGKGIKQPEAQLTAWLQINRFLKGQSSKPVDLTLDTEAHIAGEQIELQSMTLNAGDINLKAEGRYHLSTADMLAELQLEVPDLAVLDSFGIQGPQGTVSLTTSISGSRKNPVADIDLQGAKLAYQETTIGTVRLKGNLDNEGTFHLSTLSLDNNGSNISGQGTIHVLNPSLQFDAQLPLNMALHLKNVQPSHFLNKDTITGLFDGSLTFAGALNNLQATVKFNGQNLATAAAKIGDLTLLAHLADGKVNLDHLQVNNRESGLRLTAHSQLFQPRTLKLNDDPPLKLELRADTLLLKDFIEDYNGSVSLAADVTGSIKNLLGKVTLQGTKLDVGVQKLEAVELHSQIKGDVITLESLNIILIPGETIVAQGWYNLNKTYRLALKSEGFSLQNIDAIKEKGQGYVQMDIASSGSLDAPQLEGELEIDRIRLKDQRIGDFKVKLSIHEQIARLTGNLDFELLSEFNLNTYDFSAALLFNETDLAPYFKVAGQNELNGILTGKIETSGNINKIDQLVARANFSKLDVFFKQDQLIASRTLDIAFTDQKINIVGFDLNLSDEGYLRLKGTGDLSGPLNFDLECKIPLTMASYFVEDIPDFKGSAFLTSEVRGTSSQPDLNSELRLNKVGFTVPDSAQSLHDLDCKIQMTPEAITISQFEGLLDTGRFQATGNV